MPLQGGSAGGGFYGAGGGFGGFGGSGAGTSVAQGQGGTFSGTLALLSNAILKARNRGRPLQQLPIPEPPQSAAQDPLTALLQQRAVGQQQPQDLIGMRNQVLQQRLRQLFGGTA